MEDKNKDQEKKPKVPLKTKAILKGAILHLAMRKDQEVKKRIDEAKKQ